MTSASAARLAAARALVAVEGGAHLDEALDELAPSAGSDRDLAWFLGYGVLRRRGHVDAALRAVLSQPLGALDAPVRSTLRVGAFELLFARTRPHAAVHQAVEIVRALGSGRAHGLVNAVLRRLRPPAAMSEADALDHPAWLVERWTARYGVEATHRWCRDNMEPPPLFVVAKPGFVPPDDWSAVRVDVPDVYRAPAGPIPERPGFREGHWWVQDLASVQVADLVGPLPEGAAVLDACSAPGGKAYRLASRGARVIAADVDAGRLERLSDGAARLGLSGAIEARWADWTGDRRPTGPHPPPLDPDQRFDAILVDAPCTGLGTARRHPEIRWRRTEPDLERSAVLQGRILAAAAARARPGAVLVYGVCSPEPEEGPEVVAELVARDPRWEVEATLQTAPPTQGEDAHFGARLRRKA